MGDIEEQQRARQLSRQLSSVRQMSDETAVKVPLMDDADKFTYNRSMSVKDDAFFLVR